MDSESPHDDNNLAPEKNIFAQEGTNQALIPITSLEGTPLNNCPIEEDNPPKRIKEEIFEFAVRSLNDNGKTHNPWRRITTLLGSPDYDLNALGEIFACKIGDLKENAYPPQRIFPHTTIGDLLIILHQNLFYEPIRRLSNPYTLDNLGLTDSFPLNLTVPLSLKRILHFAKKASTRSQELYGKYIGAFDQAFSTTICGLCTEPQLCYYLFWKFGLASKQIIDRLPFPECIIYNRVLKAIDVKTFFTFYPIQHIEDEMPLYYEGLFKYKTRPEEKTEETERYSDELNALGLRTLSLHSSNILKETITQNRIVDPLSIDRFMNLSFGELNPEAITPPIPLLRTGTIRASLKRGTYVAMPTALAFMRGLDTATGNKIRAFIASNMRAHPTERIVVRDGYGYPYIRSETAKEILSEQI